MEGWIYTVGCDHGDLATMVFQLQQRVWLHCKEGSAHVCYGTSSCGMESPVFGFASTAPYSIWYGSLRFLSCSSPVSIALLKLVVVNTRRYQHHDGGVVLLVARHTCN